MPAWKPGDTVFARYYSMATQGYVAQLLGHVTAVGRDGFTVRRVKPDHEGNLIVRRRYDCTSWPGWWRTREEAEAFLAEHPFSVEPVKR